MSRGYVYFIQQGMTGPIKIGFSCRPRARLAELQTGSPEPLRLLHAELADRTQEPYLHERFAKARLHGEWFHPTISLVWYIRDLVMIENHESGTPMPEGFGLIGDAS